MNKKPKELREEEKRQRKFVKDVIWPYLLANTKNVVEAQKLIKFTAHVFKSSFEALIAARQKELNEGKVSSVEIARSLAIDAYKSEIAFLALFNEERVNDAMGLINGMDGAIESFKNKEMKDRTLDSLPVEFLE